MPYKCVIFIHGIGRQDEGYSTPYWNTLWSGSPPPDIHYREVFYYDVFKDHNAKIEADKLVAKYHLDTFLAGMLAGRISAEKLNEQLTPILTDTVAHVLYFFADMDCQVAVLNRLYQVLLRTIGELGGKAGDIEFSIASHSLGTVVGYLGAHRILNGPPGAPPELGVQEGVRVKNLFSLASPLALVAFVGSHCGLKLDYITDGVRRPSRPDSSGGPPLTNVDDWYSFRHLLDPVASLVCLKGSFLTSPPFEFNKANASGIHGFDNYLEQTRGELVPVIRR